MSLFNQNNLINVWIAKYTKKTIDLRLESRMIQGRFNTRVRLHE